MQRHNNNFPATGKNRAFKTLRLGGKMRAKKQACLEVTIKEKDHGWRPSKFGGHLRTISARRGRGFGELIKVLFGQSLKKN